MAHTTPEARSLAARVAAHESWGRTQNRSQRTAPARQALEDKFLNLADGDPVRALSIRKAYFARMALKSVEARRKSRELQTAAEVAEHELSALGTDVEAVLADCGGTRRDCGRESA